MAALLATVVTAVPATARAPIGHLPTPDDFVMQQYEDFLSRAPDDPGLAYWSDLVDGGYEPSAVIESLARSNEFEAKVAPLVRLYYAFFNRQPDFDGLNYWVGVVRRGASLEQVAEQFTLSNEFRSTYGSLDDGGYVDLVYSNVLDRRADVGGRSYWLGQLRGTNGLSRGELMVQFSNSPEFRRVNESRILATMLYVGMLRRTPDQAGLDYWTGVIDSGVPYRNVIAGFLGTDEYGRRMAEIYDQNHPLTGVATRTAGAWPALAVKIDNVDRARPQYGVEQADILYEELVEGRLTRLIAVFHSDVPHTVGPVRSVRTTDVDILAQLGTPLLSASGANPGVLAVVAGSNVVNLNVLEAGAAYFRTGSRSAPHNLLARPELLYQASNGRGTTPTPLFQYREAGTPLTGGSPTNGVEVDFGSTEVSFSWSPVAQGWDRTQNGSPHVAASGERISPDNVVVLEVAYGTSAVDAQSPEAHTVGSGRVWVYTAGQVVQGTWTRSSATQPIALLDGNGRAIQLTPGQTFVELAPIGSVTPR